MIFCSSPFDAQHLTSSYAKHWSLTPRRANRLSVTRRMPHTDSAPAAISELPVGGKYTHPTTLAERHQGFSPTPSTNGATAARNPSSS
jgi:hypothetical protein